LTYIAYLDEFGHIGPYVRNNPNYNQSPVFGLAGFVLPIEEIRGFGTWFFQRKYELLKSDIDRSEKHEAQWEKKGSKLYTVQNVRKKAALRQLTFRLFNKIQRSGGFLFYVGRRKTYPPRTHNSKKLYGYTLRDAIERLDDHCTNFQPARNFLLVLDEHPQRSDLITHASISMYGAPKPRRRLMEPPFQVESHRYQTMQAADWIAALVGRLGAIQKAPVAFPQNQIFQNYFGSRLSEVVSSHSIIM